MSRNIAFVCPCGCKLQLSPKDYRDHVRMLAIVGNVEARNVNLKPMAPLRGERQKALEREPSELVSCKTCGGKYEIALYLVEFLKLKAAPVPECDKCARMVTQ